MNKQEILRKAEANEEMTVAEIKEDSVLIEVDHNVKIRVSKQALVKDFSDPSKQ